MNLNIPEVAYANAPKPLNPLEGATLKTGANGSIDELALTTQKLSGLNGFFDDPSPTDAVNEFLGALFVSATKKPGDTLIATQNSDVFVAYKNASGDIFQQQADKIVGFNAKQDKLLIPEGLEFVGYTMTPQKGTYSVWQHDDHYVVTWMNDNGGWNDVIVKGDNPQPAIEASIPENTIVNTLSAWIAPETFYGTAANDMFEFESATTGDVFKSEADTVKFFDEDHDLISIPEDLVYGGSHNAPTEGTYSVWQKGDAHVVTWFDDGYHDIVVEGDNPLGEIVSGGDFFVF